jgi:outer membrane receptor for ferrienterochelin and colicin
MTRYVSLMPSTLSIALCAATLASADLVEEDIGQVFGKDENTISIATGYRQPLDLAPAVATVITAEEIKDMGATTLNQVIETVGE